MSRSPVQRPASIQTEKVLAYITRGNELLLFTHVAYPEAGVQVAGGTVEPGEQPRDALHREIVEETGLTGCTVQALLGVHEGWLRHDDGSRRFVRRYVYHVLAPDGTADRWRYWERHAASGESYEFEFFWTAVEDGLPELAGDQGVFLDRLALALNSDINDSKTVQHG